MVLQSGRGFWDITLHDQEFKLILIVASTLWVYTTIIHLPFVVPSNYTDIGYLWIRDVYSGHNNMAIPYVDYKLEYPQMIGLIIWIGQAIGTYAPFVLDAYNTYMVVESVLQYPFMIGTIYNIYVLCSKLGINKNRIYLYLLTSLTFMIYGFYNWDFIVAYFASLSIMYYLEKRYDAELPSPHSRNLEQIHTYLHGSSNGLVPAKQQGTGKVHRHRRFSLGCCKFAFRSSQHPVEPTILAATLHAHPKPPTAKHLDIDGDSNRGLRRHHFRTRVRALPQLRHHRILDSSCADLEANST